MVPCVLRSHVAASIFSTDAGWKNPSAIKAFLLDKYRGTEEAERILPSVAQIVARKKAIKAAIQAEIGLDLNSEAGLIQWARHKSVSHSQQRLSHFVICPSLFMKEHCFNISF